MSYSAATSNHQPARVLTRTSGFTLIELLSVIAVISILLAIGVPSFRYVTASNRASAEINGLLGDMQLARAEAIREGQAVTICASADHIACAGGAGTNWDIGWLVFSDVNSSGIFVPGTDTYLKIQKTFSGSDTLLADRGINTVTFSRDGFAMSLPNPVTFTLHDSSVPPNPNFTRCLSLTIVGALSTQIRGGLTAEGPPCT
jgi:type IV fimbrial biogenesis protein FimT